MKGSGPRITPPLTPWLNGHTRLKERIHGAMLEAGHMNARLQAISTMVENSSGDQLDEIKSVMPDLDDLVKLLEKNHAGASVLADGLASALPELIPKRASS